MVRPRTWEFPLRHFWVFVTPRTMPGLPATSPHERTAPAEVNWLVRRRAARHSDRVGGTRRPLGRWRVVIAPGGPFIEPGPWTVWSCAVHAGRSRSATDRVKSSRKIVLMSPFTPASVVRQRSSSVSGFSTRKNRIGPFRWPVNRMSSRRIRLTKCGYWCRAANCRPDWAIANVRTAGGEA